MVAVINTKVIGVANRDHVNYIYYPTSDGMVIKCIKLKELRYYYTVVRICVGEGEEGGWGFISNRRMLS